MIEQLHFTWSGEGLQGRGMFQVTAASPGLRDLSGELTLLALRLCRWSGGPSGDAVSFGWIDARGHRFAFRRVSAGLTGDGRPGRFAAHVLVAPDGVMSAADLLTRPAAAELWWNGEEETERALPTLDPQPLCPLAVSRSAVAPADDVGRVLVQLLAEGGAGQVSGHWAAVLGAAARCCAVIPWAFDDLRSFSTFEEGESADWFTLAGVGGHPNVPEQAPAAAVTTASMLTSADAADTRGAQTAANATAHGGRMRWHEFVALAAAFRALLSEDSVTCEELLPALSKPGTVNEVMQLRRGRMVVTDALLASRGDVGDLVARNTAAIGHDLLRQLGIDMAERTGTPLAAVAAVAVPLGRHVLDGVAEVALRSDSPDSAGWPGELLGACLRSPALVPDQVPRLADSAAKSAILLPALADGDILPAHRAQLATAALRVGTLSPATLAQLTETRPELVTPIVFRLASTGAAAPVLAALPAQDAARAVSEIARDLPDAQLLDACDALWPRLQPRSALRLVIALNSRTWRTYQQQWYAVADRLLHEAVRRELADVTRPLAPEQLLGACSGSPAGQAWRRLLEAARNVIAAPGTARLTPLATAVRASAIGDDPQARSYAVQVILPVSNAESVTDSLSRLLSTVTNSDLRAAVDAAERHAATGGGRSLARRVIAAVAWQENADRALLQACAVLARRLDNPSWELLDAQLQEAPRDVRKRLKGIYRRTFYPMALVTVTSR